MNKVYYKTQLYVAFHNMYIYMQHATFCRIIAGIPLFVCFYCYQQGEDFS